MFYNSDITVSPLEASIMLAGIIVDTNNFTMRSGTRTFEAAATLRSMGADMIFVRRLLQEPIDSEKIIAEAITSAEVYGEKFGIVRMDEKLNITDRTLLAKISDRLLTINGVQASFTIGRIDENTVGVSARSLGNDINVQTIMESMGGGGHFNSAAVQIKNKEGQNVTIKSVSDQLVEILRLEYVEGGGSIMKVILTQDVKGKGKKDEIIDVASGYGNYLISNKMAKPATEENLQIFEQQKAEKKKEAENKKKVLGKLRDEINGKAITIKLKVGSGGKNFGHITTKLVCDEFEAQTGIHLDRKKVELPGDINSIGIFTASVKLDTDIVANFDIKVEEKK
jgi:ribosomal protein L9